MKQFSQQLHKKAITSVKLQAAEKRELRERLVAYMEYHPLPAEMKASSKPVAPAAERLAAEAFTLVKVPFHALFKYGAIAAAVVLVAVPFLAERAVPGDTLYAVKVQFNEELRSTLTFDSYQKVEWETERLNRRIAEARLLASEGRLTEEVEVEVAAAVREHTENAKREIEVLRAEDADEAEIASIALDTTLEVQSTSLKGEEVSDDTSVTPRPTSLIATAIDESREPANEHATSSTPAYDKLMARVELNTTRIYELRDTLGELVSAEELMEVDRRISDLERLVQTAIDTVTTDDAAARRALVDVLQRTQRLIVFMTELEVSETVDIETIVPVVLTDEEKQDRIASSTKLVVAKLDQIAALLLLVEDQDLIEKATVGEALVEDLLDKMASSTENFLTFMGLANEATTLANDTIALLEPYDDTVAVPVEDKASSTEAIGEAADETSTTTIPAATTTEEVLPEEVIDSVATGTVDTEL